MARQFKLPREVAQLGTVLDLTTERGDLRTFWNVEVNGWLLLCTPDAIDAAPGRARLYLVRGELSPAPARSKPSDAAAATAESWNERDAEVVGTIEHANAATTWIGIATQIGYRSDKWSERGTTADYDHDFAELLTPMHGEPWPDVFSDAEDLAAASIVVIMGGLFRVTERGIA
jgi:hypothetical protein